MGMPQGRPIKVRAMSLFQPNTARSLRENLPLVAGGCLVLVLGCWIFGWLSAVARLASWGAIATGVLWAWRAWRDLGAAGLPGPTGLVAAGTIGVVALTGAPGHVTHLGGNGGGITRDQLKLATATLFGGWEEEDVLVNDSQQWTGTAFVIGKKGTNLLMLTNSHCLGLGSLAQGDADSDVGVEIAQYGLAVKFASGEARDVIRVAEETTDRDLAMVEVDGKGLKEGQDYIVVPHSTRVRLDVGDEVIAVGSPFGPDLAGTHTFGRVSALRDHTPMGQACRVIQHDAAINHGNSGGPLFVKRGDDDVWVGVNTWGRSDAQGIFFSIVADEAVKADYAWATADPAGAAQLISKCYRVPARVTGR